ncbi:MAG: response regulator transcription factor [Erysipelotrichaceae bacterium]|nr:response regulator transcription factor [Erysipelotrichaceae bacterium]
MRKILIIEDDEKLSQELVTFLNRNGLESYRLEDFSNPVARVLESDCDLVLLDINLPYYDGQYICKEIRKVSSLPIIIITSRNNEIDELMSMNYGADDFVTKPFNTQILLARINNIFKRMQGIQNSILTGEGYVLDLTKSLLETKTNSIELTKNELRIMHTLMKAKGTIVTREQIITDLWDSELFIDDNTLTVNVSRLKRKLEEIGLKECIVTKRGLGYMLK